jgi:hypothetical protein
MDSSDWIFVFEMLSKYLTVVFQFFLIGGVLIATKQLSQLKINRNHDNYSSIVSTITEHNWHVVGDPARKRAVEIFIDLKKVPDSTEQIPDRDLYWATRIVHLSHLRILEKIYRLAGVDHDNNLLGHYAQWQRFAERLASHLRNTEYADRPKPYNDACCEIWQREAWRDDGFTTWLSHLPEPKLIDFSTSPAGIRANS